VSEHIRLEIVDHVALVTLDRPESRNAFDAPMARALAAALLGVGSHDSVRAVVLTGAGVGFCAGGDLRRVLEDPRGAPAAFRELATAFHLAITEIRRMPRPVLAAVNGVAAGGGFSLALACDFRVMASSARLVQGYTSQGLAVDGGASFMLPRLVGLSRALEIAAFDRPISADQALSWGLATRVVPQGEAVNEARALAAELVRRSVPAFAAVKRLMTDSFETSLETQLDREREALAASSAIDGVEGLRAFVAKRRPIYL
jgi:2-(1,2-epoxy-1,2-dihydrophenyl)acetyl-CoA isomerase